MSAPDSDHKQKIDLSADSPKTLLVSRFIAGQVLIALSDTVTLKCVPGGIVLSVDGQQIPRTISVGELLQLARSIPL
jgi:hypothetical protein